MREFQRPLVRCGRCGAKVYYGLFPPSHTDDDTIGAKKVEPPDVTEACPRCSSTVDTRVAYPYISGFPLSFRGLQKVYENFRPVWEYNRVSLEKTLNETIRAKGIEGLEVQLNEPEWFEWFKQRLFYRSSAAFYRSLQLFFAFLVLDGKCFKSWAEVTGYYSRFYFIQAFLNLILCTWAELDNCLLFYDGTRVRCLPKKELSVTLKASHSHETWWQLMEAVKTPTDYPIKELHFILSRLVFNPQQRNTVNYDFEYLGGGFIELDWFDSGARQMMSHFMPYPRRDADITDIDRFFGRQNPEDCDAGDFYSDSAQILWHSLIGYLQLFISMGTRQIFILTENVAALAEVHLWPDYPNLLAGILLSTSECLGDGFDVEAFMQQREADPSKLSSFLSHADVPVKSRLFGRPPMAP